MAKIRRLFTLIKKMTTNRKDDFNVITWPQGHPQYKSPHSFRVRE